LEDVLSLRVFLARNNDDRGKWQTEFLMAREKMASSQVQVAALGRSPALSALTTRIPNPFSTPKNESSAAPDSTATSSTATPTTTASPNAPAATPSPQPSPTTGTPSEPQLVSAGSLSGRELKRVTPAYPAAARTSNISGTVRVFAIIDENGKVWVTNSEGPLILRSAAEEAARAWTFPPSTFAGKPARIAGYLDFQFKL
jgi:TonB family protein